MIPAGCFYQANSAAQEVGGKADIGISEHEPLVRRAFIGPHQCMRLAQPPRGKLTEFDDSQIAVLAGEIIENLLCRVGGTVVDYDYFKARIILREEAAETFA